MCIWKAWKKVKTKVANLIRCGINKYKAYEWGNTCKGYWRIADSPILKRYLQPIITQYFIDNKSEIWLLFLIAHSKR